MGWGVQILKWNKDGLVWVEYLFIWILVVFNQFLINLPQQVIIDLVCIMTGKCSEKRIVRQFHHCVNVIRSTDSALGGIALVLFVVWHRLKRPYVLHNWNLVDTPISLVCFTFLPEVSFW